MYMTTLAILFGILLFISWFFILGYITENSRIQKSNERLPLFFHSTIDRRMVVRFYLAIPAAIISAAAIIWIISVGRM